VDARDGQQARVAPGEMPQLRAGAEADEGEAMPITILGRNEIANMPEWIQTAAMEIALALSGRLECSIDFDLTRLEVCRSIFFHFPKHAESAGSSRQDALGRNPVADRGGVG
jgi:hypothetical protein